jgi:hypothetical protein
MKKHVGGTESCVLYNLIFMIEDLFYRYTLHISSIPAMLFSPIYTILSRAVAHKS